MKKSWLILVVFILTVMFINDVKAEEHIRVTKEDVTRIGQQLYAPGSEGQTVDYCQLYTASTMRSEIVELLKQGYSDAEIIDVMVEQYGEQVLAAPRKSGFNLSLWLLPIFGVGVGIWSLTAFLRNKYRKKVSIADPLHFNEKKEQKIKVIQEQLKLYLQEGSEHVYEVIDPLYKDLVDLEYDYLMGKVDDEDYEEMKQSMYLEIIASQEKKEGGQ